MASCRSADEACRRDRRPSARPAQRTVLCRDGGGVPRDRRRRILRHLLAAAGAGDVRRLAARSSARACCSRRGRSISCCRPCFAARGQVDRHRAWGLLGVSLATAMVIVGFAVANDVLVTRLAAGYGDRARAFHIVVDVDDGALRRCSSLAAVVCVSRPEIHKRLMVLATISILPPAMARLFFAVSVGIGPGLRPSGGPPRTVESVLMSALMADVLILAGVDLRRAHARPAASGVSHRRRDRARRPGSARTAEHDPVVVRDRGLPRAVQRLSIGARTFALLRSR